MEALSSDTQTDAIDREEMQIQPIAAEIYIGMSA